MGVQIILQNHHSVGVAIRCGYVGGYPLHGTGPRGIPGPVGMVTERKVPMAAVRQGVGVQIGGGSDSEGEVRDDGDINLEKAEYGCTVNY